MRKFKAESQRLLDLMINSIYTHKEIFLRELISNASDATDKRYYNALTGGGEALGRDDLPIEISLDKENRILRLSDKGVGMTKEELEANLGTIAHSGSLDFKKDIENGEDVDIIGQFGVGFYSAFMVADRVEVLTRPQDSEEAWSWKSAGVEGYTVDPAEKADPGTEVILHIKEDTEDESYGEFLDTYRIRGIVKKYSDYIRYPIRMEVEKSRKKEDSPDDKPEYESYTEVETLNSMTPIWKKGKGEVSDEELNGFYKDKFNDYQDPMKVIHSSTEGAATYTALLFIPAHAPMNYFSKDYQKGLQLYASGVMIMDKCADLLPDYFGFVRGLVDSQDLSLNISRETLQHDRQLKVIESRLEKKIKSELMAMKEQDREKYEEFFTNFGLSLKYGVYENYGMNKELLQDLLIYKSSFEGKMTDLESYVSRMKEDQKYIYYAAGDSVAQLEKLPAAELVKDKGYEILYMTDDIDEFCMRMLNAYNEKEFRSIADGDLGIESEEEKQEKEKQAEENKDLLSFLKETLEGKVEDVRLSNRLKSYPVWLSSEGGLSLEMEKVLNAMPVPDDQKVKAQRVLELNGDHPIFQTLTRLYDEDKDKVKTYAGILYNQALLMGGIAIEDPVAYSNDVLSLME